MPLEKLARDIAQACLKRSPVRRVHGKMGRRVRYASLRMHRRVPQSGDIMHRFMRGKLCVPGGREPRADAIHPVSYTHLTLPTNREV